MIIKIPKTTYKTLVFPYHSPVTVLCPDWFIPEARQGRRYNVDVRPLVNGEKAFAAVAKAIASATRSIDIISWGFDPAMRLTRPDGPLLGDLLEAAGKRGCEVRVLIWKNAFANFVENTIIGDGLMGSGGTALGSGMARTTPQIKEDIERQLGKTDMDPELREIIIESLTERQHEREARLNEARQHTDSSHLLDALKKERQAATKERIWLGNKITQMDVNRSNGYRIDKAKYDQLKLQERLVTGNEQKLLEEIAELESAGYGANVAGSAQTANNYEAEFYTRDWFNRVHDGDIKNVEFRTRDFSNFATLNTPSFLAPKENWSDRIKIFNQLDKSEPHLSLGMIAALVAFASHHQKTLVTDYELPQSNTCRGFVMGHNFHRNYWDTSAHAFDSPLRDPGFGPWQDISSEIRGEAIWDLNKNFVKAWDRENSLYTRLFGDGLQAEREYVQAKQFRKAGWAGVVQILRTQPQEDEQSIRLAYERAIRQARSYIYMENQYFRYPKMARKIKDIATVRHEGGADPLHLFIVTNNPNEGHFSSTTYATMKELGQQQLMPRAHRDGKKEMRQLLKNRQEYTADLAEIEQDPASYSSELLSDTTHNYYRNERQIEALAKRHEFTLEEIASLEQMDIQSIERMEALHDEQDELAKEGKALPADEQAELSALEKEHGYETLEPETFEQDGLEIAIGTLVAHKQEPGEPCQYKDIYVHSKLLLVDDVYFTLGSANVNTRSMETDSELNIGGPVPEVAREFRDELWPMHTNKRLAATIPKDFKSWSDILVDNWSNRNRRKPLTCNLTLFWDIKTPYATAFD